MPQIRSWIALFLGFAIWQYGISAAYRFSMDARVLLRPLFLERPIVEYGLFSVIVSLIAVLVLTRWIQAPLSESGFSRVRLADVRKAFLLLWVLFPVFLIGRIFDPSFDAWFFQYQGFAQSGAFAAFIPVVILFAVIEELWQRFFQGRLQRFVPFWIAAITLSLNFALLHGYGAPPEHAIGLILSAMVASLILATLFFLTGNLVITVLLHIAVNLLSLVGILAHVQANGLWEPVYWIVFGGLFALTFRAAWRLVRFAFQKKGSVRPSDLTLLGVFVAAAVAVVIIRASG